MLLIIRYLTRPSFSAHFRAGIRAPSEALASMAKDISPSACDPPRSSNYSVLGACSPSMKLWHLKRPQRRRAPFVVLRPDRPKFACALDRRSLCTSLHVDVLSPDGQLFHRSASGHRAAGSSPAGCMAQPEQVVQQSRSSLPPTRSLLGHFRSVTLE